MTSGCIIIIVKVQGIMPGLKSSQTDSKEGVKATPNNGDALFARLRRLEARVTDCEAKLSTARRDINRIDKAEYRAKAKDLPSFQPARTDEKYNPLDALWGGA